MKKLALLLLFGVMPAWGQFHNFPALDTTNVYSGKNLFTQGAALGAVTVANLPTSPLLGTMITVSNPSNGGDCSVGGGNGISFPPHACFWNGSAWSVLGSAGLVVNLGSENSISIGDNVSVADAPAGQAKWAPINGVPSVGFNGPLSAIETAANVGAVNGIAGLDGSATVPIAQIVTSTTNCNGTHVILGNKTCGTIAGTGSSLLTSQGPAGAVTGTGAAATLYSYSIPGGTMGTATCIRARAEFQHTGGTASLTYTWNFAGTTSTSSGSAGLGSGQDVITICNTGATNAQVISFHELMFIGNTIVQGTSVTTSAIDTTSAQTLSFQFTVAATDAVTPKLWMVESLH